MTTVRRSPRRSATWFRTLGALAILVGLFATFSHPVRARGEGVVGNTYTGAFHDWSVTWDEDAWEFGGEDNRDGYDSLELHGTSGGFAIGIFLAKDDVIDAEDCARNWLRTIAGVAGANDFERDDPLPTPDAPRAAVGYSYTYSQGSIEVAAYVQCRMLAADGTALSAILTTSAEDYDEQIERFGDLLDAIEIGDGSGTGTGTASDDEPAESGIEPESKTYVSPTYGYALDWSGTVWEPIPDDEVVNGVSDDVALDRLLLYTPGSKLYVEGRVDYDGDAADCIKTESEILEYHDNVTDIEPVENEEGYPMAGETDAGGEYATYRLTQDGRDGEEITRIAYVECRTLVKDEAVLVISLYAIEETYDEFWDDATSVIDTIELDGEQEPPSKEVSPIVEL